nr:MAG TPA: minor tail protein [Caudoviricetes sp.]
MADRIKGITVQIGGDTTGLSKALSGVNKQIKTTQNELKDVEKLLKLDPSNVKLLAQKQRLLAGAVEESKTKLDSLKAAEKEVKQQFKDGVIDQSKMDAFNRELIDAKESFDAAKKAAQEFGGVVAQEMQLAGQKVGEVGEKISGVGQKMMPATGAVAAVATASVAAFNELDAGYDTIVTKTGATGEALDGLQESMRNLFGSLPIDAETAGIAIGEVNTRFGVTGEELEDLSRQFIQFSEINGTDLNSSIDSVDALMTKFGVDSSQTGEVLGLLTKAGQDTGISMDTLENALNTNGATLKEMGLDLTGSVNLLAQFEANGVDATTALAGLKKAQQNATANGQSLGDALGETIQKIKDSTDETEALQTATELFGKKGAAEMTQAIREGRLSVEDLTSGLGDYATTVEDTFNATLDPPDQAKVALNNLKIAGAELGETMMATLAPIIDKIVVKLQEFSAWFTNLDESQKQTILVIGAVVAAIGPAVVVIGKVVSGVGSIISAVGTVVGVITGTVIPAITGFVTTVGIVPIAIVAAVAAIIAAIALFGDQIQAVLQGVDDFLQGVFATDWTNIFGPVLGEILNVWFANIKNIWDSIKTVFDGIIDFIRGVFTGDWERAWTGVKEIFGGIFDGLKAVAKAPLNAIIGMVNMAISGINGVIGGLNKIPGVNIGEIGKIPYLAKGGVLSRGSAVVGEAGPELLTMSAGRAVVQPLTNNTTNNSATYGNVTINVYGAAGQSVNELADIVMYKMQGHVERREAVWT